MHSPPPAPQVPAAFLHAVRGHLQQEAELIQQVRELSSRLTEEGFSADILALRRPELDRLLHTMAHLRQQRSQLRTALGRLMNVPPEQTRLSRLPLPDEQTADEWRCIRTELAEAALDSSGTVRAVQKSLGQWSAVVSSALEAVLTCSPGESRYTASGQRRIPPDAIEIEMRT